MSKEIRFLQITAKHQDFLLNLAVEYRFPVFLFCSILMSTRKLLGEVRKEGGITIRFLSRILPSFLSTYVRD